MIAVKESIYFCLILYVVAIYMRPAEIWFNFPYVELLAAVSAVVGGVSYLVKPRKFWDLPHDKFVLGLWFAIVVSNLSWGWLGGAAWGFTEYLKVAFYYFLIRFAVRERWQFERLIELVIVLNVILALSGILQFHGAMGLGGVPLLRDGRIRATGIFNDPNDLAFTLVMVIPFLFEVAEAARSLPRRVVALISLAALVLAIFYTSSRSGVLGLAAVVVGYALRRLDFRRAAAVVVVLALVMLAWGAVRIGMPHSPERESAGMRIHAWAAGLMMFKADPLFGVGYGRFDEFHEILAHNSFVHVFAELGIIGAFFWVGMCYWFVKGLLVRPPPGEAGRAMESWRPALLLSFIGTLVMSWFLSRQYVIYPYTLFGLGAAYVAIAKEQGASVELKTSLRDAAFIFSLIVAGMGMLYVLVRLLQHAS